MKDVKELMITKYLLFLATWNIAQNEKEKEKSHSFPVYRL